MVVPRLLDSHPGAAWLPSGSTAQMWGGRDCPPPRPAIIVRLLLVDASPTPHFFTVPTSRGLDLPTRFLGGPERRESAEEGLSHLCRQTLGATTETECVGYVLNHVPTPDSAYPHPVPDAYVPVFTPRTPQSPAVDGAWLSLADAEAAVVERHWWPIVVAYLRDVALSA